MRDSSTCSNGKSLSRSLRCSGVSFGMLFPEGELEPELGGEPGRDIVADLGEEVLEEA